MPWRSSNSLIEATYGGRHATTHARQDYAGEPRESGDVKVAGQPVRGGRPDYGVAAGLAYLPPDRRSAVVSGQTARENLVLAKLRVHWRWP